MRRRRKIAIAAFIGCFFGSLSALIVVRASDQWAFAFLVLFSRWAIAIRWWMVAGALLGILFTPVHLHVIYVEEHVRYAVGGAVAGLILDFFFPARDHFSATRPTNDPPASPRTSS